MGPDDEAVLVDEPRKPAPEERADPVDPVVGPVPAGERRPEGPCGVHGGAGECPAGEDVGADDESGEDRALGSVGPLLRVDDGGVDGEEEGEREDYLPHYALEVADSTSQRVYWSGL